MNEKIFVIAGHVSEYTYWVKNNIDKYYAKNSSISLSHFVYVSGPEVFRGFNEVHGVFVGSFRNRQDIRDIVREIRLINGIPSNQMVIPDMFVGRGVSVI